MSKAGMLAAVSAAAAGAATGETITVDAAMTAANIKTYFPDVAAALIGEGKAEAKAEAKNDVEAARKAGADAERERILGIEKAALPGHEAIIAAHKADATKTPADAAMAIIEAEKGNRGKQLKALETDEDGMKIRGEPANPGSAPAASAGDGKEGVDKYKAEWAADPKLASEFSNFEAYASLRSMEEQGRVKVYKGRAA